jgi:hypothetical protein
VSFDRIASVYHILEALSFGGRLQECRKAGLPWIQAPRFQKASLPDADLEPERYDLLVTNFFLDCLDSFGLEVLLPKLDACLTTQASCMPRSGNERDRDPRSYPSWDQVSWGHACERGSDREDHRASVLC